jgi:hypothetical protein
MFAYSELKSFFRELIGRCDVFTFAGAVDAGRAGTPRTAILRHDVDVDVEAAVALTEVEAELGIRSTLFFLTGADTYNLASATNRRHLRRLAENGFEVALHFDPLLYPDCGDDELMPALQREADWLADISGQPVRSVSLHNPSTHGRYPRFEGFLNAYDPMFFDPDFYLSDSCMSFRGKDPFEFVKKADEHALQVLLHPLLYSETGALYPELFGRFLNRFADRIDETLQVNATYVEQMGGRSLMQSACAGEAAR